MPFSGIINRLFKSCCLCNDTELRKDLNRYKHSEKKLNRDLDIKSIINTCREFRIIKDWYDYKHYEEHQHEYE